MSNVTSTSRPQAQLKAATNPVIYNVPCATAGTEYNLTLSSIKKFLLRARNSSKVQLSFITGETNVNFVSIGKGVVYTEEGMDFSGTLYFQCSSNSEVIEVVAWT